MKRLKRDFEVYFNITGNQTDIDPTSIAVRMYVKKLVCIEIYRGALLCVLYLSPGDFLKCEFSTRYFENCFFGIVYNLYNMRLHSRCLMTY